jgi:hypothetical protein
LWRSFIIVVFLGGSFADSVGTDNLPLVLSRALASVPAIAVLSWHH